jgi:diacylglycerol kinase (ATP)
MSVLIRGTHTRPCSKLPRMRRVDIVFNPNSGRGRAAGLADHVALLLRDAGVDARPATIGDYLNNGPVDASADCVVALGGDGTVRAVVDGLQASAGADAPPVAIGAVGTANLVARHLRLPWSADANHAALVRAILAGRTYAMDVAVANDRPFLIMCSVGFDARVVHELAAHRTGPISMLHYLPAFARSWVGFAPDEVEVIADGRTLFGPAPGLVVVGNAAEYGTGFSMTPDAVTDDGKLDVSVFTMDDRKHLVSAAFHAAVRQVGRIAASVTTAREVQVLATSAAPAQVDGEPFGHAPVRIGLLPHRQRFIVARPT